MDSAFHLVSGAGDLTGFFQSNQDAPHASADHSALALICPRRHMVNDLPHLEPTSRESPQQVDNFVRVLHSNILHTCCLKLPSATL